MFEWLFKKKYDEKQIELLIKKIKDFNAGAIDDPLSKYIDEAYKEWKTDMDGF